MEKIVEFIERFADVDEATLTIDIGDLDEMGDEAATLYASGTVFGSDFEIEESLTVDEVVEFFS